MISIQFRRGTRSDLDYIAKRRELLIGEPFFLTDENRFAIATTASTYSTFALESEITASSGLALLTITKNLTLNGTSWQDTGIVYSDIPPGSYALQMYANDNNNLNQWYTGVVSWVAGANYGDGTDTTEEIVLNSSGGTNKKILYLRTLRVNDSTNLKLQIYSNYATNSGYNYVFKFRELI